MMPIQITKLTAAPISVPVVTVESASSVMALSIRSMLRRQAPLRRA
jgi:hypothetical protein